jgi:putative SOS response-associated peptidase YedK
VFNLGAPAVLSSRVFDRTAPLTFASSGGRCATKAARLASASRRKTAVGKQPYEIALADRRLMTLADLWETWRSAAGERIRSFTIVTTTPNELCAELHNRMPVVLQPDVWPLWLGEQPADCRSSRRCWPPALPMR